MDKKELEFILQEGEGLKIEFKETFDSKNLAKEITAFANSEGGRIFTMNLSKRLNNFKNKIYQSCKRRLLENY